MARRRRGSGMTALITGASGGIGVELARCFAKDGYNVVLAARSREKLDVACAGIAQEFAVSAIPLDCDLGRINAGTELVKALEERGLAVDVLVNNAGYGQRGPFAEGDLSSQLGMVDLNIRTLVELTGLLWPRILKNGRGGILNVGSTGSFQPGPYMAVYCASKAFVLSFTEALWEEARGTSVCVSCLCPGATRTGFQRRAGAEKLHLYCMGMMGARRVARLGYRGFRTNRRVTITGIINRMMVWTVPFSPRSVVLRVGRRLLSEPGAVRA